VRVGDGRPHDEVDHRLGDHPDQVHVGRDAVLELRLDVRAHRGQIEVDHRAQPWLARQLLRVDGH
jgi:hypothetical protein